MARNAATPPMTVRDVCAVLEKWVRNGHADDTRVLVRCCAGARHTLTGPGLAGWSNAPDDLILMTSEDRCLGCGHRDEVRDPA